MNRVTSTRSIGGIGQGSKAAISSICHFDEISDDGKSYKIQKRLSSRNNDYEQLNVKAICSNRIEPSRSMLSLREHLQRS